MAERVYAIVYNPKIAHSIDIKDELQLMLKKRGVSFGVMGIDELKAGYDFVFVIGGDGTILKASRFYANSKALVFGINLGRLGFLSQCSAKELDIAVNKILNNEYYVENRVMLEYGQYTALNDFVIKSSLSGRTSRFSLKINGRKVCDYLADGIIISTPTGSTAYGLSAGGPVLVPTLKVFVVVPICPHTLTARPLVIPDSENITICAAENAGAYFFSADGQEFMEVNSEINIKKSPKTVSLALLDGAEFYSVLRDKLHWGTSPANIR
ncbi:NAD(+)/NADH kinase [bacterium]|nr:NAD(+)/NADH kinase [bacterium]